MIFERAHELVRHLHRLAAGQSTAHAGDQELVERFVTRRDETAFEALVRRHGPMVLGVCRALLPCTADAEDAFQATFLIFARKAGSIRKTASLSSWLHGVARRTALKAHAQFARRH